MDPVSSLIGTISHFFDYMNPSRSPYMLGVIVAAVVLFMFKDSPDPDSYVWELMFLVPVTLATAFFGIAFVVNTTMLILQRQVSK